MRNIINIQGNDQTFRYLVEYLNSSDISDGADVKWNADGNIVYLLEGDTQHYKSYNEWYCTDLDSMNNTYIPEKTDVSTVRIYLPRHSVDTYARNIKYALTAHTYINGYKINLGSLIFRRIDTLACNNIILRGNDQYYEYIDMDIISPYDIMYSDNWLNFRKNVCDEPVGINNTGALLTLSLYVIEEYEDKYIIKDNWIGGYTSFNICNESTEFMQLSLSESLSPLGWRFDLTINQEYNWLLDYLNETYGINVSHNDINYEIVLKAKDAIIAGPCMIYSGLSQLMSWDYIKNYNITERTGFYDVFKSWNTFEEGWFIVGSINITQIGEEILSVVSNQIPLTQEIFKYFVDSNRTLEKLIDISDMEIINYNVVNKIENTVVQLERPNSSKSNIIQPVFFKVKDTEKLTLHPAVTENICINLDDYKSKTKSFKLQIEGCIFNQIGVNQYGVLFKVVGPKLPNKITSGTYYVLNEDEVLVTSGKYKYVS